MSFKAIDQVFDASLPLPAGPGGKIYRIPEPDFETGTWCVRSFLAAQAVHEGREVEEMPELRFEGPAEEAVQRRLLSSAVYDEMRADGLGPQKINFCVQTVLFWNAAGRDFAEMYWNAGGKPEDFLPAANREARRRRAAPSTNTGAAPTTKRQASTNGTSSPRKATSKR